MRLPSTPCARLWRNVAERSRCIRTICAEGEVGHNVLDLGLQGLPIHVESQRGPYPGNAAISKYARTIIGPECLINDLPGPKLEPEAWMRS